MFQSCGVDKLNGSDFLRLDSYDCIGFDLDNTLCVYNSFLLVEMEYKILANYLVIEKAYDPSFLLQPLDKYSLDFLQKGLLIDFSRGNLLKIAANGIILRASHGSRFLSDEEVMGVYGNDKKWNLASELCKNAYEAYECNSDRIRLILDNFDLPASLAFARIIDSVDKNSNTPVTCYNVWPDVLAGLQYMYKRENFTRKGENFFYEIKSDPSKYIKSCNTTIIQWLKRMRESGKITFLITGSNYDFASLIAEVCLGKNWQDYFDVAVFYARKPGFFNGCRPFINIDGHDGVEDLSPVMNGDLGLGNKYSQGNWQELYNLFSKKLNKAPKCVYFGDHLVQDVITPSQYTKCHSVAVVEELVVEDSSFCTSVPLLNSKGWGSYFLDETQNLYTLWAKVIETHSKMCIPSLSVLAQYPLDHEFRSFQTGPLDGYFPFQPRH